MEKVYKKVANRFKGFLIFYGTWFIGHLTLLVIGKNSHGLWPFAGEINPIYNYGPAEFLFYISVPVVILLLSALINRNCYYKLF